MVRSKIPENKTSWIIWAHAKAAADTLRDPFLVLDYRFQVLLANKSFYKFFQLKPEDTEGRKIDTMGDGQWNIPKLRSSLDEAMSKDECIEDVELAYNLPVTGPRVLLVNIRALQRGIGLNPVILMSLEDAGVQQQAASSPAANAQNTSGKSANSAAELKSRVNQLERLNKAMVGRELKMVELKQEIKELKKLAKGR